MAASPRCTRASSSLQWRSSNEYEIYSSALAGDNRCCIACGVHARSLFIERTFRDVATATSTTAASSAGIQRAIAVQKQLLANQPLKIEAVPKVPKKGLHLAVVNCTLPVCAKGAQDAPAAALGWTSTDYDFDLTKGPSDFVRAVEAAIAAKPDALIITAVYPESLIQDQVARCGGCGYEDRGLRRERRTSRLRRLRVVHASDEGHGRGARQHGSGRCWKANLGGHCPRQDERDVDLHSGRGQEGHRKRMVTAARRRTWK